MTELLQLYPNSRCPTSWSICCNSTAHIIKQNLLIRTYEIIYYSMDISVKGNCKHARLSTWNLIQIHQTMWWKAGFWAAPEHKGGYSQSANCPEPSAPTALWINRAQHDSWSRQKNTSLFSLMDNFHKTKCFDSNFHQITLSKIKLSWDGTLGIPKWKKKMLRKHFLSESFYLRNYS